MFVDYINDFLNRFELIAIIEISTNFIFGNQISNRVTKLLAFQAGLSYREKNFCLLYQMLLNAQQ